MSDTKYAIKLGSSFYYDGFRPNNRFDNAGFVPESVARLRATSWEDRARAEAVVRHWWDNDGNPKTIDQWHCSIDGQAVGLHLRVVDEATKKTLYPANTGPRPEVVEVEDVFGRDAWSEATVVTERGPYEYRSQYLTYGMQSEFNNYNPDLPATYPQCVARNIPDHEVDGWEFYTMANDHNGLFRRLRKDA